MNHRIQRAFDSFLIIFLTLFLSTSFPANSQTTYYVDADAGSDNWTGTVQTCVGCNPSAVGLVGPWKSLYQVFVYSQTSGFKAGDQILLKRGQNHYAGNETTSLGSYLGNFGSSGEDGAPIIFDAYGQIEYDANGNDINKPVIRQRVALTKSSEWVDSDTPGVWMLKNKTFSTDYVWEDDKPLKRASSLDCLKGIGDNCPDGSWYHIPPCSGCNWDDLHYRPTTGAPIDHVVHHGRTGIMQFDDRSYLTFRNLDFRASYIPIRARTINAPVSNIIVENSIFYATSSGPWVEAINYDVSNFFVRHNKFIYTNRAMVTIGEKNTNYSSTGRNFHNGEIAYNESKFTNGLDFWPGDQEHFYFQNINNYHIHHNSIIGGGTTGIAVWYDSTNPDITLKDNIFEYNLIKDLHGKSQTVRGWYLGAGTAHDNCSGNAFRYNVVSNTDIGIVPIGCFVTNTPPNQIYNNTIVGASVNILGRANLRHWIIKNNISLNPKPNNNDNRGVHIDCETCTSPYSFTFDNNLYYPDGAALFSRYGYFYNFDGWKKLTNQDVNSITVNPQLINPETGDFYWAGMPAIIPGAGNYQPEINSPVINKGADVGLSTDIAGNPIVGLPDIGAYELRHADLLLTNLTVSSSANNLVIGDTVTNQGTATAYAFDVSYYLSIDANYQDGIDTFICKRTLTTLEAGTSTNSQTTCATPALPVAGPYYVIAVIDSGKTVDEINETNNSLATANQINIGPDLLPTAVTASNKGTNVSVSSKIKNQGNRNVSSTFTVTYYISTNNTYEAETDIALASNPNGIGVCYDTIVSLNASEEIQSGMQCYRPASYQNKVAYYVLAVVDSGEAVAEPIEFNNSLATTSTINW